jgi:hypothetical protein
MRAILNENEDAYWGDRCDPLVPTLMPRVYANRFVRAAGGAGAGAKVIYHLYNSAGHTVDGPVLALPTTGDTHVLDLLTATDYPLVPSGDSAQVSLYLPREGIACLAVLPRLLNVTRQGDALTVTFPPLASGEIVLACDAAGAPLATVAAAGSFASLDLRSFPAGQPACLKLLSSGILLDAAAVPTNPTTGGTP